MIYNHSKIKNFKNPAILIAEFSIAYSIVSSLLVITEHSIKNSSLMALIA